MIRFTPVPTPDLNNFVNGNKRSIPLRNVESQLVASLDNARNEEFKKGRWNSECTEVLIDNPTALYLFDRFSYCLSKAYGHKDYKVLINPLYVFCYHKSCCCAVKLKHMFDIKSYMKHCLVQHSDDAVGESMLKRLTAVEEDNFITARDLDAISRSPFSLQPDLYLGKDAKNELESLGIIRDHDVYVTHWKEKFIQLNVIQSNSLSFQEDEALIYMLLKFPDPVQSWSTWSTLELYCTKLYCSISSAALNLYRGITGTRLSRKSVSVTDYCKNINHPGPSLTTEQHRMPPLNYESETVHGNEIRCHLFVMEKNEDSIKIEFSDVVCYLATVVIDEQEINQGAFILKNKLYGFKNPMTVDDLKTISLSKLSEHITQVNDFISSVREYRLMDFNGYMCTNVTTSFESSVLTYKECTEKLNKATTSATTCLSCLKEGNVCDYKEINQQCTNCLENGHTCVRFAVFHILWDMGSSHVKTKKSIDQIEEDTPESLLYSRSLHTIGFGGLHLAKALVNTLRNHIITNGKANYGLNVFRSIKKQSPLLKNIKQAVYVAKDRQSDLLSYLTCSPQVLQALDELKYYQVRRVPEPTLAYTKNAKTQKDLIFPISIITNINGDIFILDKGACCVHVIDRCVVSRVFTIGKYSSPCDLPYGALKDGICCPDVRFSNHVKDIAVNNNDIYVLDAGRDEIVVVPDAALAKMVNSKRVYIMNFKHGASLAHDGDHLLILSNVDVCIQFVTPVIPKKYQPKIGYTVERSISLPFSIRHIFSFSSGVVGAVTENDIVYSYSSENSWSETEIKTKSKPSVNDIGNLCVLNEDGIRFYDQSFCQVGEVLAVDDTVIFQTWGDTLFVVNKISMFSYVLEEIGSLSFGAEFSSAINDFYKAISYAKPGQGAVHEKVTLRDSIKLATPLVNLLKEMQSSLETNFSRSSFQGEFGSPWTQTMNCVIETVDSWSALVRRLDFFDPELADKVYSHSITNESWIEHSFGFTTKQGQGHSQEQKEYVESKRRHAIDFQIRMTDTPFCQYTKIKVRDKGYQSLIDVGKTKLSVRDILQIFGDHDKNDVQREEEDLSEQDEVILRQAYLLTKSVPRQNNRTKWKDTSGFQPNLLEEVPESDYIGTRCLLPGHLVFSRGLEDELVYLLVHKKTQLDGKVDSVSVCEIGNSNSIKKVPLDKLVLERGLIAVIPSTLFSVPEDGDIMFDDDVNEMVLTLAISQKESHNDDDWAILMSAEGDAAEGDAVEEDAVEEDAPTNVGTKRKISNKSRVATKKHRKLDESCAIGAADSISDAVFVEQDSELDAQNDIGVGSFVQVVKGPYQGLYAKVTNDGDGNEVEINYFQEKKTYGGSYWVLKDMDYDFREKGDLKLVMAIHDDRNRFMFEHTK